MAADGAVRTFLIRTLLEDSVSGKIDKIVDTARSLAEKAVQIVLKTDTTEVEKQLRDVKKAASDVANIDSSKTTKSYRETSEAARNLKEHVKSFSEQSRQASETVGNLFNKIDAGRLIMGAAGAGMALYVTQIVDNFESFKLDIDLIQEKLGSASSALVDFAMKGGQASGTMSMAGRASLENYMSMTGYDAKKIQPVVENTEKIMHSEFGRGLAQFGITSEKDLLQKLTGPLDQTSDLGRAIKAMDPSHFTAGRLENETLAVGREARYAFQPQPVIEAEARRRIGERSLETIAGKVKPDEGYVKAMDDMGVATENFKTKLAATMEPGVTLIADFVTNVLKMASAAPEVTSFAAALVGVGIALGTVGAVLPLLEAGWGALSMAMLANPFVLTATAVAGLVIGLIALESKFHVFSQAWEKFSQSAIGKDVISSVTSLLDSLGLLKTGDFFDGLIKGGEKVSAFIGAVFDKIDSIYKLAKGGDLLGALRGGAELALRLSPIGLAAGMVEALIPLTKVQKDAYAIFQDLKTIWHQLSQWIFSIIDPIIALYGLVRDKVIGFLDSVVKGLQKAGLIAGPAATPGTPEYKNQATALKAFGNQYKNDEGGRVFDVGDAWYNAAIQEAITGEKQDTSKLGSLQNPLEYQDMVNFFKNKIANPDRTAKEAAPLPGSNSNPFYDPSLTNEIKGPAGISPRTKPAEEVKGSADVEGGLQTYARMLVGWLQGGLQGNGTESLTPNAVGGEVVASVDPHEVIVPAEVSRSSELLSRLREIASGGAAGGSGGIKIDKIEINLQGQQNATGIAGEIRKALETELSDFNFGLRTEGFVHRADRGYKA